MAKLNLELASGDIDYTAYNGTLVSQKLWCGEYSYYIAVTVYNLLDSDIEHNTIVRVHEFNPDEYQEDYGVEEICSFCGIENWDDLTDERKVASILDYQSDHGETMIEHLRGNSEYEEDYQERYEAAFNEILARVQKWHDAYA